MERITPWKKWDPNQKLNQYFQEYQLIMSNRAFRKRKEQFICLHKMLKEYYFIHMMMSRLLTDNNNKS